MEKKEGERLKNYIKGLGLEMNQLAKSLNMSRQNLNYHLRKEKLDNDFVNKVENVLIKYGWKNIPFVKSSIVNEPAEEYVTIRKEKGTEIIDNIQFKALIKINRLAIAKLMAKVYNRDVADCLEELENDTKLAIRELVGKHE